MSVRGTVEVVRGSNSGRLVRVRQRGVRVNATTTDSPEVFWVKVVAVVVVPPVPGGVGVVQRVSDVNGTTRVGVAPTVAVRLTGVVAGENGVVHGKTNKRTQ
mgnify:CR=1 FL=1